MEKVAALFGGEWRKEIRGPLHTVSQTAFP